MAADAASAAVVDVATVEAAVDVASAEAAVVVASAEADAGNFGGGDFGGHSRR